MSIYIKNYDGESDVYTFLDTNFCYNSFDCIKFVETYSDKECTQLECHPARRSLEDLIEIVQTYIPDASDKDVAKALFELNRDGRIGCLFCGDIQKIVFYKRDKPVLLKDNIVQRWHGVHERGHGKYSISEIYNLADEKL